MNNESASLSHILQSNEGPGFKLHEQFADKTLCDTMLKDVIRIARSEASGGNVEDALFLKETQEGFTGENPEDLVAKIFRLHRKGLFRSFLGDPRIASILTEAIGPNVDSFLSQFIFKNPGAWGQPWHQDSLYFNFEPARPIVGLWLAVTEATLENGCLHILPGSQSEPIHQHVPDARPGALGGYLEIVDHDMSASQPCLLSPGDLLIFDSHLMHRSTDNESSTLRAAMVWHCVSADTVDNGTEINGEKIEHDLYDFMPVVRDGRTARELIN